MYICTAIALRINLKHHTVLQLKLSLLSTIQTQTKQTQWAEVMKKKFIFIIYSRKLASWKATFVRAIARPPHWYVFLLRCCAISFIEKKKNVNLNLTTSRALCCGFFNLIIPESQLDTKCHPITKVSFAFFTRSSNALWEISNEYREQQCLEREWKSTPECVGGWRLEFSIWLMTLMRMMWCDIFES